MTDITIQIVKEKNYAIKAEIMRGPLWASAVLSCTQWDLSRIEVTF